MKEEKIEEIGDTIKKLMCSNDCNSCMIYKGGCKSINEKAKKMAMEIVNIIEKKE